MPANVIITNNFRIALIGFNYRQNHHGYTVLQHITGFFPHLLQYFPTFRYANACLAKDGNVTAKALGEEIPVSWFNFIYGPKTTKRQYLSL